MTNNILLPCFEFWQLVLLLGCLAFVIALMDSFFNWRHKQRIKMLQDIEKRFLKRLIEEKKGK